MTTVFNDVIFPDHILAMGVQGKSAGVNERTRGQGGYTQVDIVRGTLREINLAGLPLGITEWSLLDGLFEVTGRGAFGMLVRDPKDRVVQASQGVLRAYVGGALVGAAGVGYGAPVVRMFQRKAAYGTTRTFDRRITRPQSPSAILRNGSPVPVGVAAGNCAIDYDTGSVIFVADATQSVTAVTVGATTSVTLGGALAGVVATSGRLWLQGLGGTDAALLNGKSHAVSAKAGNVYTLTTNTAGKTITAAGVGVQYPQPTETLTWSGMFYVPMQFRGDELPWKMFRGGSFDSRLVECPEIVLIEIPEQ